jgi:hypothetical protein
MLVVAATAKLKAIPYVGVLLPMGVFRPFGSDAITKEMLGRPQHTVQIYCHNSIIIFNRNLRQGV